MEIPKGLFKVGTYDDLDNPYHYFRIDEGSKHDRMVIGGEDHRQDIKINPQKNFKALEEHLKRLMGTNSYTITRKWTGQIIEPVDGLPMIGAGYERSSSSNSEKTIFVATGFSGTGLTFGTLSGKIISDLIIKGKNPYAKLYNPLRTPTAKQLWKKGIDYSEELIGGAVSNFFKSA